MDCEKGNEVMIQQTEREPWSSWMYRLGGQQLRAMLCRLPPPGDRCAFFPVPSSFSLPSPPFSCFFFFKRRNLGRHG